MAAEFQLEPRFADSPIRQQLMAEFHPDMTMGGRTFFAGVAQGRLARCDDVPHTACATRPSRAGVPVEFRLHPGAPSPTASGCVSRSKRG